MSSEPAVTAQDFPTRVTDKWLLLSGTLLLLLEAWRLPATHPTPAALQSRHAGKLHVVRAQKEALPETSASLGSLGLVDFLMGCRQPIMLSLLVKGLPCSLQDVSSSPARDLRPSPSWGSTQPSVFPACLIFTHLLDLTSERIRELGGGKMGSPPRFLKLGSLLLLNPWLIPLFQVRDEVWSGAAKSFSKERKGAVLFVERTKRGCRGSGQSSGILQRSQCGQVPKIIQHHVPVEGPLAGVQTLPLLP